MWVSLAGLQHGQWERPLWQGWVGGVTPSGHGLCHFSGEGEEGLSDCSDCPWEECALVGAGAGG